MEALRTRRSGLIPCAFEDVDLETYIAKVEALDTIRVRSDLAAYDCRNNRLAQLCLEVARVEKVRIRVEKPGAVRFSRSVGVEIERAKEDIG